MLHTVATTATWYGRFGYHFGRGAYKITAEQVTWDGAFKAWHHGGAGRWALLRSVGAMTGPHSCPASERERSVLDLIPLRCHSLPSGPRPPKTFTTWRSQIS